MISASKIFFRADASHDIGLGHVMRCLALASMIKKRFHCTFLIKDMAPGLENLIAQDCADIIAIPSRIPHDQEAAFLSKHVTNKDIVVLDGYSFDTRYQSKIRLSGCRIVSIDDIHTFHFVADAVINHAGGIDRKQYSTEPSSELYLGPEYALIREEFLTDVNKGNKRDSVLICMGGSDKQNYTRHVLEKLHEKKITNPITVVVGKAYAFSEELKNYVAKVFPSAVIYRDLAPKDLADVMHSSGVFICSPSTVAYEYLMGHGELYLIKTAENQKNIYQYLITTGLAFDFNHFQQVDDDTIKKSLSMQAKLFDGKASQRLLNIFEGLTVEPELTIRKAQEKDSKLIFDWANDVSVRRNSFSKNEIQWEDHRLWFRDKINSGNSRIYIISKKDVPVGQARFDIKDNKAFIDYSVEKRFRGKSLGIKILKLAILEFQKEFDDKRIIGEVLLQNVGSQRTFECLKFLKTDKILKHESATLVYEFYKL